MECDDQDDCSQEEEEEAPIYEDTRFLSEEDFLWFFMNTMCLQIGGSGSSRSSSCSTSRCGTSGSGSGVITLAPAA